MSSIILYLVFSVLYLSPGSVIIASGQGKMTDVKVLEKGDDWQCPSMEERERARNEIHQIAASIIDTMTTLTTTSIVFTATTMSATSTRSATTSMPTTTSATIMSTITDTYTCNGTPGWRRIAFINMTNTSYNCPTGLRLTSYSKRTCGRSHTTQGGCSSTTFSVGGLPYNQVCGRIRGYQFGATSAFLNQDNQGIDGYYVEGVSLTHGGAGSRQHIWTFAAGLSEVTTIYPNESCPCDTAANSVVPSFVGNDYFCESGFHSEWNHNLYSTPMMSSGMVRTVHPPVHAVSSTTLHGLLRSCLLQQLMTLN